MSGMKAQYYSMAKLMSTTIRLDPEDIAIAKKQAERLGLKYQTYLKMIIRQELNKNGKKEEK
jgi:predicted DNA binding CopG/RHH family protein